MIKRCLINFPIGMRPSDENNKNVEVSGFYYDAALNDKNLNVRVYRKDSNNGTWEEKPIGTTINAGMPSMFTSIQWTAGGNIIDSFVMGIANGAKKALNLLNNFQTTVSQLKAIGGFASDMEATQKRSHSLTLNTIHGAQGYKTFKSSNTNVNLPDISFYFTASKNDETHVLEALEFLKYLLPIVEGGKEGEYSDKTQHGDNKFLRYLVERAPNNYATPTSGWDFDTLNGTYKIVYCGKVYADYIVQNINVEQSVTKVLVDENNVLFPGGYSNIPYIVKVTVTFIPAYYITQHDFDDFLTNKDENQYHTGWNGLAANTSLGDSNASQ